MSHVPHELPEEFPEQVELLRTLRQSNTHLARICDEYHEINRTLHRAETNVEPMSDMEIVRLRKSRMMLKDEVARVLRENTLDAPA